MIPGLHAGGEILVESPDANEITAEVPNNVLRKSFLSSHQACQPLSKDTMYCIPAAVTANPIVENIEYEGDLEGRGKPSEVAKGELANRGWDGGQCWKGCHCSR